MQLPIEVVPNTNPPRFKWSQIIETVNGKQKIAHEGMLPTSVEKSVVDLIEMTKAVILECSELRKLNEGLTERIAQQSELLTRKAEVKPASQPTTQPINKGKR